MQAAHGCPTVLIAHMFTFILVSMQCTMVHALALQILQGILIIQKPEECASATRLVSGGMAMGVRDPIHQRVKPSEVHRHHVEATATVDIWIY